MVKVPGPEGEGRMRTIAVTLAEDEIEQLRKAATERVAKLKKNAGSDDVEIDRLAALGSALRKLGGASW